MHDDSPIPHGPTLDVYRGDHIRVVAGANLGDGLAPAAELVCDDVYRLSPVAAPLRLTLALRAAPPFAVAEASEAGTPGAELHFDCTVTLMSDSGAVIEALLLVETDAAGHVAQVWLHPLSDLRPRADYALVGVATEGAVETFAAAACVSFARGTRITLASGEQRAVEDLTPGDRVLTRDDGPQPLRWIGHATVRAEGAFAPVLIRAGALNNARDLVVSPDHRLFVYQRRDRLGAGRSELLVRACHLVNGASVIRRPGGYVEYYRMLFDHHQIVYAEGIAAESMLLDGRTRAALPDEVAAHAAALLPAHRASDAGALEVQERLLRGGDAAALLRRSSGG